MSLRFQWGKEDSVSATRYQGSLMRAPPRIFSLRGLFSLLESGMRDNQGAYNYVRYPPWTTKWA